MSAVSPAEADAYRGGFLAVQGQTTRAVSLLQKSTAAEPKSALARQNLTLALFFAGRRAEAARSASVAIALDPSSATSRYIRAYLSFNGTMLHSNAQMESDLRAAVAADSNFAPPHALLAAYLAAQDKNLPEALEAAQTAVSLEPENSMYQLVWAKVLGRVNRYDESRVAALHAREAATALVDREAANLYLDFLDRTARAAPSGSPIEANANPQQ